MNEPDPFFDLHPKIPVGTALAWAFVSTLAVLVALPLMIVVENPDDFTRYILRDFFMVALGLSPLVFTVLAAVGVALVKSPPQVGGRVLQGLLFLLVFWGFFIPLNMGLLDEVDVPTLNPFALLLAAVMFFGAWGARTLSTNKGIWPLMLFLLIQVGYFVFAFSQLPIHKNHKPTQDFYALSQTHNTFVITLDSLQSNDVAQLFRASPELQQTFSGFTFFSNTAGPAPWTNLSALFMKAGVILNDVTISDYVAQTQPQFITNQLRAKEIDVHTYGQFSRLEPDVGRVIPAGGLLAVGAVHGYTKALKASLYRYLPGGLVKTLEPAIGEALALLAQLDAFKAYSGDVEFEHLKKYGDWKEEILQFDQYEKNLYVGKTKPAAHFSFFTFPHFPYKFDAECTFQTTSNPSHEGAMNETRCGLKKLQSLVQTLKGLGVYDQSLIILNSDHGQECGAQLPSSVTAGHVSQKWCLSRYMPLLMVKPVGAQGRLKEDYFQASLLDIPKTVCAAHLDPQQCQAYEGVDLLHIGPEAVQTKREILVSQEKGPQYARQYEGYAPVNIGRTQMMHETVKTTPAP